MENAAVLSSGQRMTVDLLKAAAIAAGQIREEIAAIKASATTPSDAEAESPRIMAHGKALGPQLGGVQPAAQQSPPPDLREPASPFTQAGVKGRLLESARRVPSGEQQAPPKPDDGDEEKRPVMAGRWHPSQQHLAASGAPDAYHSTAVGRLEEKLNGCVCIPVPATGRVPGRWYPQLSSMPAHKASGPLQGGSSSRRAAASRPAAVAEAAQDADPHARRAAARQGTQDNDSGLQRRELIARMQQANSAMRRIQRPVSRMIGPLVAAPAARVRGVQLAASAAAGHKAQVRGHMAVAAARDPTCVSPSAAQAHVSQSRFKTGLHQDRSYAVQTQISLSALLSICDGAPDGAAAPQQMKGPATQSGYEAPEAPAPLSPLHGDFAEGGPGAGNPGDSPLRQLVSSRLLEARTATAEARAANQEAALAVKQRLAAVAATAKAALGRATTPRKGPTPPAAYESERPTASHTTASGPLPAGGAQAPSSILPIGYASPAKRQAAAASAADSAPSSVELATPRTSPLAKSSGVATGPSLLPSDWPKVRAPPPTWCENPGPPLPETFSTPSRKPVQRPSFAAAGSHKGLGAASGWWTGAGPSPRPGDPQTPSSCAGMSSAGCSPISHKPWTPAGARIRTRGCREEEEEPPTSSKRRRPTPTTAKYEEGTTKTSADVESIAVGTLPSSRHQPEPQQQSLRQLYAASPDAPESPGAQSYLMASPEMHIDAIPGTQSNVGASPHTPVEKAAPEASPEALSCMEGSSHSPFAASASAKGSTGSSVTREAGVEQLLEHSAAVAGAAADPSPLTLAAQAQASPNSVLQLARTKVRARFERRGDGPAVAGALSILHTHMLPPAEDEEVHRPQPKRQRSVTQLSAPAAGLLRRWSRTRGSGRDPPPVVPAELCTTTAAPGAVTSWKQAEPEVGALVLGPNSALRETAEAPAAVTWEEDAASIEKRGVILALGVGAIQRAETPSRPTAPTDAESTVALQQALMLMGQGITDMSLQISPAAPHVQAALPELASSHCRSLGVQRRSWESALPEKCGGSPPLRKRPIWIQGTHKVSGSAEGMAAASRSKGKVRYGIAAEVQASRRRGSGSSDSCSGGSTAAAAAAPNVGYYSSGSSDCSGGGGGKELELHTSPSSGALKIWIKHAVLPAVSKAPRADSATLLDPKSCIVPTPEPDHKPTVAQHPVGARLLRELPELRLRAVELLAALEGGLPVHKAWVRAPPRALHGSRRTVCVHLKAQQMEITYASGLWRRNRSNKIARVQLHDEEQYILVCIQNGHQLVLRPANSEAYALWVLGLNAAVACAAAMTERSDFVSNMPWML